MCDKALYEAEIPQNIYWTVQNELMGIFNEAPSMFDGFKACIRIVSKIEVVKDKRDFLIGMNTIMGNAGKHQSQWNMSESQFEELAKAAKSIPYYPDDNSADGKFMRDRQRVFIEMCAINAGKDPSKYVPKNLRNR